ncbi:MAG: mechanosensitive ion channel domain-containing protein [Cyanobacteria bacterium P01_B01_bin.77]
MRKLFVRFRLQAIAITTALSFFIALGTPALSQEVSEEAQAEVIETAADPADSASEAEEDVEEIEAITANNPDIPADHLEVLLKPLSKEQLEAEANAWLLLLQDKAREISDLEYSIKLKEQDIGGEVDTQAEEQVIESTELNAEQTVIASRLTAVLDSLDNKGGDTESYRQYIAAVSGLEFNITDTEGLGLRFNTWLQSEEGGIKLGINLLKFISILAAAFIIAPRLGKIVDLAFSRVENISTLFRDFIVRLTKQATLAAGALLSLAAVGVNLGPVLAVLGGASFVLAFALQSNLGNFASGLMLLINKPFDVGDEVIIAGHHATVDSISLANTKLTDFNDNHVIIVPNNTVWGSEIKNYTSRDIRRVMIKVNVSFSTDINYLTDIWRAICAENPDVLEDPKCSAFPYTKSYDYYVTVNLKAWTPTKRFWYAYADLLKAIQVRLPAEGIQFVSPEQYRNVVQPSDFKALGNGERIDYSSSDSDQSLERV